MRAAPVCAIVICAATVGVTQSCENETFAEEAWRSACLREVDDLIQQHAALHERLLPRDASERPAIELRSLAARVEARREQLTDVRTRIRKRGSTQHAIRGQIRLLRERFGELEKQAKKLRESVR